MHYITAQRIHADRRGLDWCLALRPHDTHAWCSPPIIITVKYFNASTRTAIVRSSRNFYEMVRQAICLVTAVGQHPASLQVLHLGGECVPG